MLAAALVYENQDVYESILKLLSRTSEPFIVGYAMARDLKGLDEVIKLLELGLLYIVVSESYLPTEDMLFARRLIKFARLRSYSISVSEEVIRFVLVVNSTNPNEDYFFWKLLIERKVVLRFTKEAVDDDGDDKT